MRAGSQESADVEDLSDIEREEQLRRWWSENWAWIIGGVALGLALLGGWQYWQRHQVQTAEADEAGYVAVVEALGRNDRDAADSQAKALRERRPDSPYADQADLALARAAVERRDLDGAAALLRGVADRSGDPELRLIARVRLARLSIEQGKFDEALALLEPSKAGAFAPLVHEIRGDAYAAKGDAVAARGEYDAALKAAGEASGLDRNYLEIKRDALSAAAVPAQAPAVTPAGAATPATPAPATPATSAPAVPATQAPAQ
jgi:predicted negative regulator of RcsB-dependent stress response